MAIVRRRPETGVSRKNLESPPRGADAQRLLKIAEEAHLSTVPLDIDRLIRVLGLRIKRRPLSNDISGHLQATDEGWVVSVNSLHHPSRQRFTLAHELGHYVLHRSEHKDFIDKTLFRSQEFSPMEREANNFAAELLMPENEFRRFVREESKKVEDIAAHFDVSALAVRVRAKELNFKGHGL